jgi:DNA repair exonuclease SbcCD nuclease subunit
MKIAVLSDFHFGYGWNTRLEEDSFENAQEAISKCLDSDLILIAGDIFDSRLPRTETWAKALKVLSKPLLSRSIKISKKYPNDRCQVYQFSLSMGHTREGQKIRST